MTVWMKVCAFLLLLGMCGLNSYAADDDIIEFLGDRYVIHVDKMNPDSEICRFMERRSTRSIPYVSTISISMWMVRPSWQM